MERKGHPRHGYRTETGLLNKHMLKKQLLTLTVSVLLISCFAGICAVRPAGGEGKYESEAPYVYASETPGLMYSTIPTEETTLNESWETLSGVVTDSLVTSWITTAEPTLRPIVFKTHEPLGTQEPTVEPTTVPMEPTVLLQPDPTPRSTQEPMADVPYVPGYTNETFVNFRSKPSTQAEIIMVCRMGTEVLITGKTSEWFRIEIDDKEGYIARPYITVGWVPTPAPVPTQNPKPENSSMYTVYPGQFSDYEIGLVAALIHCEGPGSSYVGYRAIASIVLNRVLNMSGMFPNDVSGVLFQQGQFGYSRSYLESVKPNSTALAAAKYVFSTHGSTLPKKVLFYRAAYLGKNWYDFTKYYATIEGNCYFYGIKYY